MLPATPSPNFENRLMAKMSELERALSETAPLDITHAAEELERITLANERDLVAAEIDRQSRLLAEVRSALERISEGSFGQCEQCDRTIPLKRLQAIPWARCCVRCQEEVDRTGAGEPGSANYSLGPW